MDSATYTLLESAHGALNLTNVLVRGDSFKVDRAEIITETVKFHVSVDVTDEETPGVIQL
jgi:hypothetical protein